MIDSHCHLADTQFDADREEVIARAKKASVTQIVCIADTLEEAEKCRIVAEAHEGITFTVGIHPHVAKSFDAKRDLPLMRKMAAHPKCRAIGEIGLDYHYMNNPMDTQKRTFEEQLKLAKELNLPAVVHCRESVKDVWTIVNHVKPQTLVVHCCTEKWEDGERFVKAGYFLSFTGIATYPKSSDIRETIKQCPQNQLMIETDSPYLAPLPHRGKRNEPAFVVEVARIVAEIKGISLQEVDTITTRNAVEFFHLTSP